MVAIVANPVAIAANRAGLVKAAKVKAKYVIAEILAMVSAWIILPAIISILERLVSEVLLLRISIHDVGDTLGVHRHRGGECRFSAC